MVNSEDFVKRLEKILRYYDISASGFADQIGVQRSSISHLLSARNKPSLEFVMKVVKNYPDVNLYWLLNGKGSFPNSTTPKEIIDSHPPSLPNPQPTIQPKFNTAEKKIEKIIIFYSDGSFKSYHE